MLILYLKNYLCNILHYLNLLSGFHSFSEVAKHLTIPAAVSAHNLWRQELSQSVQESEHAEGRTHAWLIALQYLQHTVGLTIDI